MAMPMYKVALVFTCLASIGQGSRTAIETDQGSENLASETDQGSQLVAEAQQSIEQAQPAPNKRSARWAALLAALVAAASPAAAFQAPGGGSLGLATGNAFSRHAITSHGRDAGVRLAVNDQNGDTFTALSPEAQIQDLSPKLQATVQDLTKSAATIGRLAQDASGLQKQEAQELRRQLYASALAVAIALGPPEAALAADLTNGLRVFSGNCAACHQGGNNVIQPEKTLRKEALEEYLAGGLKPESIEKQVRNGKNAMPAFGGRLTDNEITDVAAYVYDQATNGNWDDQ